MMRPPCGDWAFIILNASWVQRNAPVKLVSSTMRHSSAVSCSGGLRTVVPEECVSDKHESPHFANLYDMALKYADVLPFVGHEVNADIVDVMLERLQGHIPKRFWDEALREPRARR